MREGDNQVWSNIPRHAVFVKCIFFLSCRHFSAIVTFHPLYLLLGGASRYDTVSKTETTSLTLQVWPQQCVCLSTHTHASEESDIKAK